MNIHYIWDKIVIWLLKNAKVKIETIIAVCNRLDKDEDGYVSLGELVRGILDVIRK